jgi:hypothetical protein
MGSEMTAMAKQLDAAGILPALAFQIGQAAAKK